MTEAEEDDHKSVEVMLLILLALVFPLGYIMGQFYGRSAVTSQAMLPSGSDVANEFNCVNAKGVVLRYDGDGKPHSCYIDYMRTSFQMDKDFETECSKANGILFKDEYGTPCACKHKDSV